MPYAIFDRDSFISRTGLGPDMKVLIIGPDSTAAIQIAQNVETTVAIAVSNPQQSRGLRAISPDNLNPLIAEFTNLPFKNEVLDIIFSYHSLNSVPKAQVSKMLSQVHSMLKKDRRFAAIVWSVKPTNKAQESHLMMLEILEQLGLLHLHGFDEVSRWLEAAGFKEITMELVTHQLSVPENWVRSHLNRINEIVKEYRQINGSLPVDIDNSLEVFKKHVKEYGEELLPSIQFTAIRCGGLDGIDMIH
ncbi:MAG TPA: class I SAM-dependent methyltransferase [Candidatus Nanoarchaeia archaeon]|nr:class I SAM-dependent methyltransferase [Candidatus Nanoarchaeia archaeon]